MATRTTPPRLTRPVSEHRDHILGSPQAPVTLVEYGDFECPSCGAAEEVLHILRAQIGGHFRLVYRHFPLTQVHPHAQRAAEASECAAAQRRFWDMHDELFAHQDDLDDSGLLRHADAVGLDTARFMRELQLGDHAPRVREDFLSGVRSGVNGTPTFFINGARHDGAWDPESLAAAIRDAEAGATGL